MPTRIMIGTEKRVNFVRGNRSISRRHLNGESTCEIPLDDSKLSGSHAFISRDEHDNHWVWDCGSKNGTFINGARVNQPERLFDGDTIVMGHSTILFRNAERSLASTLGETTQEDGPLASLNPSVSRTLDRARSIAPTRLSLLIEGQPGTGKRACAREVHRISGAGGAFVEVAAEQLLEHILALRDADQGTLYLTSIDRLSNEGCIALVAALKTNEVIRADGTDVKIRLIASCRPGRAEGLQLELRQAIGQHELHLPPLSSRREDIGALLSHTLRALGAPDESAVRPSFSRALHGYEWPGNSREFVAAIEHAVAFGQSSLSVEHLPPEIREFERGERQRREFVALLDARRGNVSDVARALGIARQQVHRIADRYGIDIASYRVRLG